MNQILEQLGNIRHCAGCRFTGCSKKAEPLAEVSARADFACAEVTFRTDAAEESIRIMSEKFPEMLVGEPELCSQPSRRTAP